MERPFSCFAPDFAYLEIAALLRFYQRCDNTKHILEWQVRLRKSILLYDNFRTIANLQSTTQWINENDVTYLRSQGCSFS